jgi:hypothetical protein
MGTLSAFMSCYYKRLAYKPEEADVNGRKIQITEDPQAAGPQELQTAHLDWQVHELGSSRGRLRGDVGHRTVSCQRKKTGQIGKLSTPAGGDDGDDSSSGTARGPQAGPRAQGIRVCSIFRLMGLHILA